jgi:uncharacterized protein
MAPGLPDRVDCEQLADDAVVLERVYPLAEMPRLRDVVAGAPGSVQARFAFAKASGRAMATVSVEAMPQLVCQRCLQSFAYVAAGSSEVEFAVGSEAAESPHEAYTMENGHVSLRELAEEELLLALPIVAMHPPQSCARGPTYEADATAEALPGERSRPFAALQDLLKKT